MIILSPSSDFCFLKKMISHKRDIPTMMSTEKKQTNANVVNCSKSSKPVLEDFEGDMQESPKATTPVKKWSEHLSITLALFISNIFISYTVHLQNLTCFLPRQSFQRVRFGEKTQKILNLHQVKFRGRISQIIFIINKDAILHVVPCGKNRLPYCAVLE
jgi:hypothetical protein